MTRVLLVSNMYAYPGNWDKLDELGRHVQLEVVTPARWATADELHPMARVPLHRGGTWRHHRVRTITQGNPFRHVFDPFALAGILRRFRPQIVHVEQEPESLALLELALLKPIFGYRLVFVAWENVNPLRLGSAFRRVTYALTDGAIFGNVAALERARAFGYRGPAAVLPQYGFDVREPADTHRNGTFRVGYAGRLVPEKGLESLLEAVDALPGVELVVAGDGPLGHELVGRPGVRWDGRMERGAMDRFWAEVDVLVLPSLTTRKWAEQFGRVLVEAMARGVVPVGSSSGAIPEVIGDAGLVFEEGDAMALSGALQRLASDADLRGRLAAKGIERVRRLYAQDVVSAKTVAFYDRVLRG